MATVKLVAKKSSSRKDGTTPIYLQFSYNPEKRTLINTHFKVEPKYWNFNKDVVNSRHPEHEQINQELKDILLKAVQIIHEADKKRIDPTIEYFMKEYKKDKTLPLVKEVEKDIYEYMDEFIENSKRRVVIDVIKDYKALKKHLKGYEKHNKTSISLNTINYSFYEKFVDYLTYDAIKPNGSKGLSANTVGKQIKNLKAFINNLKRKGLAQNVDTKGFITLTEEVDKIHLSEDEINKILKLDLNEHKHLEKYRDMFVFSCFTAFRYIDFSNIKPANIRGSFIYKMQSKTQNQVVVPIRQEVHELLEKYNNKLPEIGFKAFNESIKEIGKLAGLDEEIMISTKRGINKIDKTYKKYELLSSHTGRRSFCTNEYLKGTPPLYIMKISGHKTEKSFLTYIKIAEEVAAQKVLEYWEGRV